MINRDRTDIRLLGQEHDQGRDSPSIRLLRVITPLVCRQPARALCEDYGGLVLDLSGLDLEEIATALADQTDYEHRWLISPETGEVVFWTSDTGIDSRTPVELEELVLICIDPHKRATSPARGGRALDRSRAGGQDAAGAGCAS
jgi:hypothetical protein